MTGRYMVTRVCRSQFGLAAYPSMHMLIFLLRAHQMYFGLVVMVWGIFTVDWCPLVLLVDGSNPIDVTDPRWEIFMLVRKGQEDSCMRLLGFAAVYRFHGLPDSTRLRLGQILIIPTYQRKGYGRTLLEVLNNVAIRDNVYDLSIEEPVDSLQHVRNMYRCATLACF